MKSPPSLETVIPALIRDALQRRTMWQIERTVAGVRVRVPIVPKSFAGVVGLIVLIVFSAALIAALALMLREVWAKNAGPSSAIGTLMPVMMSVLVPIIGVIALTGMWHIVLFVNIPESRRGDAVRVDRHTVSLLRLKVEIPRTSCRELRLVKRRDPPGVSNKSDATRHDLRLVYDENGTEREIVIVPYGHKLERLLAGIAGELGVPANRVDGPPWTVEEITQSPPPPPTAR